MCLGSACQISLGLELQTVVHGHMGSGVVLVSPGRPKPLLLDHKLLQYSELMP